VSTLSLHDALPIWRYNDEEIQWRTKDQENESHTGGHGRITSGGKDKLHASCICRLHLNCRILRRIDGLRRIAARRTVFRSKNRNIEFRIVIDSGAIGVSLKLPLDGLPHVAHVGL